MLHKYGKAGTQNFLTKKVIEKAKNRTCEPSFKGIRYSKVVMAHISSELLNDELAIEYLQKGALKESDFKVLPKGYKEEEEEKPAPKKRGRKPKNNK